MDAEVYADGHPNGLELMKKAANNWTPLNGWERLTLRDQVWWGKPQDHLPHSFSLLLRPWEEYNHENRKWEKRPHEQVVWEIFQSIAAAIRFAYPYRVPKKQPRISEMEHIKLKQPTKETVYRDKAYELLFRCLTSRSSYQPPSSILAWNDGTVKKMAKVIYREHDFDRLPLLADALEDAGCTNADMLAHCRQPGPHVRGCWAVDLVLGKK
jgi:hypothetical protein